MNPYDVTVHILDLNDITAHTLDLDDVTAHILDLSLLMTSRHTYIFDLDEIAAHVLKLVRSLHIYWTLMTPLLLKSFISPLLTHLQYHYIMLSLRIDFNSSLIIKELSVHCGYHSFRSAAAILKTITDRSA